jgi:hypothetical protein
MSREQIPFPQSDQIKMSDKVRQLTLSSAIMSLSGGALPGPSHTHSTCKCLDKFHAHRQNEKKRHRLHGLVFRQCMALSLPLPALARPYLQQMCRLARSHQSWWARLGKIGARGCTLTETTVRSADTETNDTTATSAMSYSENNTRFCGSPFW